MQMNQVQGLDDSEERKAPARLLLQCWMEMRCNGRQQTGGQLPSTSFSQCCPQMEIMQPYRLWGIILV